jgi:hypothetical protein
MLTLTDAVDDNKAVYNNSNNDVAQRGQSNEEDNASATLAKTQAQCWRLPLQTTTAADPVDDNKARYNNNATTTMMSRDDASAMRETMPA